MSAEEDAFNQAREQKSTSKSAREDIQGRKEKILALRQFFGCGIWEGDLPEMREDSELEHKQRTRPPSR